MYGDRHKNYDRINNYQTNMVDRWNTFCILNDTHNIL